MNFSQETLQSAVNSKYQHSWYRAPFIMSCVWYGRATVVGYCVTKLTSFKHKRLFKLHPRKSGIKRYVYFELPPQHFLLAFRRNQREKWNIFGQVFSYFYFVPDFTRTSAFSRIRATRRLQNKSGKREKVFWMRNASRRASDASSWPPLPPRPAQSIPVLQGRYLHLPATDLIRPEE